MGILSAAMFFVLSNAKPLEQLSARRPHPNIFCAYVFLSLLGQFAVHLVYLVLVWNSALATMPPVRSIALHRPQTLPACVTVCSARAR